MVARVGGAQVRASFVVACDGATAPSARRRASPTRAGSTRGCGRRWTWTSRRWPYRDDEIPVFLDADGFWAMPLPGGRVRLFFRDDAAGPQPEIPDAQAVIDRHVPGGARVRHAHDRGCFRLRPPGGAAVPRRPAPVRRRHRGLDGHPGRQPPHRPRGRGAGPGARGGVRHPGALVAAAEAGHELAVAYRDSPIIGGEPRPAGPASPRAAASPTPARSCGRTAPRPACASCCASRAAAVGVRRRRGARAVPGPRGPLRAGPAGARDRARRGAAPGPPGVEALADATLAVHGRLGAVREAAFVVRPDGYLGFRAEPPDADRIAGHLGRLGVTGPATRGSG